MFIDTHCHPYLAKIKQESEILDNFKESGGKYLVSIGTNLETSQKSLDLSKNYEFIFATVGIHPTDVLESTNSLEADMKALEDFIISNPKNVVGIGETGLDYHWVSKDPEIFAKQKEKQYKYFLAHIQLAQKYNLPIIIHNRYSGKDILKVLQETKFQNFIIHCFSEDLDFAKKCLEISPNSMMSFSGIVTFKNAQKIAETAAKIPLKNILIETDSPFLTPDPFRGKQENEPAFTQYVLEKIIQLRSESREEITQTILKNSEKIYNFNK